MKSQYPILPSQPTPQELEDWIRDVTRLRQLEDLPDYTNLPNIFISGRSVSRTAPTSNSDIDASDVVGDWLYNGGYLYICVDDSGTAKWGRITVNVSW